MPDSSELLKNIVHYQKSLDRYSQSRDDAKILHCIFKLFNMPVTVNHLEKTGIGKTVNSLRKLGGEVEDAAKTLVRKWKDMVSEKDDENEAETRSNGITNREGNENNSSHKHSDKHKNSDRKGKPNKDDKSSKKDKYDNHRHQSTSESKHKSSSSKYSKEEVARNSYESDNDEDNESGVASESEESSMEEEEPEEVTLKFSKHERESGKHSEKETRHKESSSAKHKRDSEGAKRKERSLSREKIRKHESQSEHDHRKRQKHDSSSSDAEQMVKTNKSSGSKRKYEDSASDEEIKKKIAKKSSPSSSHRSNSSHRSKESSYEHKRESKIEAADDSSFHKSSHKSKESNSSRDRKESSKSDSNKKESRSTSKSDSKCEKRKLESYKEDSTKSESAKYKKEKSNLSENDRKRSNEREKSKSRHSSKSNSSSNNPISSASSNAQFVDIGSESGTSFAEALGMLEPTTSKISSKKWKPSLEVVTHHKTEKPERERTKEKSVIEKPSKSDNIDLVIPPPPPKSDLDINIASLLPPITPNYRPVSNPFFDGGCARNKVMNDDEALSLVMSQKNMRTKVYSGNKCFFGTVPTLFELCIRVLQDNIDALEYTGGVPYAILKPILDKATPDQLFMLEHHNPYLIEDTDDTWKFHCQKEFRNKKREELETWREMYMRCLDEREAKLKALTENIKLAQDKSTPVRQTKLAYVDSHSIVKPPRDVIRKQAKSGFVDKKPVVTPSSRLTSIASAGTAGQVAVPSPARASSSSGSSAAVKPKKAPLMQKTLQFLKGNRFRR